MRGKSTAFVGMLFLALAAAWGGDVRAENLLSDTVLNSSGTGGGSGAGPTGNAVPGAWVDEIDLVKMKLCDPRERNANGDPLVYNECNAGLMPCKDMIKRLGKLLKRQVATKLYYYYQGHDVDVVNTLNPADPKGPAFGEPVCDPMAFQYKEQYRSILKQDLLVKLGIDAGGPSVDKYGTWAPAEIDLHCDTKPVTKAQCPQSGGNRSNAGTPPPPCETRAECQTKQANAIKANNELNQDEYTRNFWLLVTGNSSTLQPLPHDRMCCGGSRAKADCGRDGFDSDLNGGWAKFEDIDDDDPDLLTVNYRGNYGVREISYVRGAFNSALNCHMRTMWQDVRGGSVGAGGGLDDDAAIDINKAKITVSSPACQGIAQDLKLYSDAYQKCEPVKDEKGKIVTQVKYQSDGGIVVCEMAEGTPSQLATQVCAANAGTQNLISRLALCEVFARADAGFTEIFLTDAAHETLERDITKMVQDCYNQEEDLAGTANCYIGGNKFYNTVKSYIKDQFSTDKADARACKGMVI